MYLQEWLQFNGCSASQLNHTYLKLYIKLKLIELGIQIFYSFYKRTEMAFKERIVIISEFPGKFLLIIYFCRISPNLTGFGQIFVEL